MTGVVRSRGLAALAQFVIVAAVSAGPLDPPAGPIASTPGPEPRTAINATNTPGDDDSVFRIAQPGSYYLTGNVTGATGKCGIEIGVVTGRVAIDLNGYSLEGVAGATQGIRHALSATLTVTNGSVNCWGLEGVRGVTRAERLNVFSNGASGIQGSAFGMIVSDCVVNGNGAANNAFGIATGSGSIVSDCIVSGNGGAAAGGGISVGSSAQVARCVVVNNANAATGSSNGHGISTGSDSTVVDCRVNSNGSLDATGTGGIAVIVGSSVLRCQLYNNRSAGIRSGGEGVVADNVVVASNGSATSPGILVGGGQTRIDGNFVVGCGVGIRVNTANCVVVRNTARTNVSNYSINPGNDVGPISSAAAATSPMANIDGL